MAHRQTEPQFTVTQLPNGMWSVQRKGVQIRTYHRRAWAVRTAHKLNKEENVGVWLAHQAHKAAASVDG